MSRTGTLFKVTRPAIFFAAIALALVGIQVSCRPAKRSSAKSRIHFVHVGSYREVEASFKEKGKRAGTVAFEMDEDRGSFDAVVRRRGKEVGRFQDVFTGGLIGVEIGTLDLERNGSEVIFVGVESSGNAAGTIWLNLLCPRKLQWIWLSLGFVFSAPDAVPDIRISDNFHIRALRKEREFLVQLMYDYGYMSELDILRRADDPEFAYYFWKRENGSIQDGYMTVRKYNGKSKMTASVSAQLQDGDILYTGYFKAGVEAYDKRADEHWIVFHPYVMYCWPHELRKVGDLLIIECSDEGLAVVNTKTHHLKRIPWDEMDEWLRNLEKPAVPDKDQSPTKKSFEALLDKWAGDGDAEISQRSPIEAPNWTSQLRRGEG